MFDWAQYRRTNGAVLFDHQGLLPSYAAIINYDCLFLLEAHGVFFPRMQCRFRRGGASSERGRSPRDEVIVLYKLARSCEHDLFLRHI